MTAIRAARPSECERLSSLALRSKAHWGYDDEFLAAAEELAIHPADLDRMLVMVATAPNDEPLGFFALECDPPEGELTALFVEPDRVAAGLGRLLWEECVAAAAERGVERMRIESDPFAEGFYVSRGAVRTGTTPSQSIPGRELPLLRFDISSGR